MRKWGKFYFFSVLLIATIVLVTSGTMAFYNASTSLTSYIETAGFTLKVNESTETTQTLSDMTLAPGDAVSRDMKIDTSGLDTPSVLTVTLAVCASGELPPGFAVFLDGEAATGIDDLTATKVIDNAEDQVINMAVSATWTTSEGEDLEQYRDLSISYDVTVAADQKAGG